MADRIIFVTMVYIFQDLNLSCDNINEVTGKVDGLLKLLSSEEFPWAQG